MIRLGCVALLSLAWTSGAAFAQPGEPSSASGSLGGGVVGGEVAAVASADVDLTGWGAALGLGMRLRFVDGELLAEDWNERSDIGRVLRYLEWTGDLGGDVTASVAAGQLTGVELGHGSIVNGYAAGVDFDRGRAGLDARFRRHQWLAHVLVDDLLDPELLAARVERPVRGPLRLGATSAFDIDARRAGVRDSLWIVGLDASVAGRRDNLSGALTVDGVAVLGFGAGLHLGARGTALVGGDIEIGARAEARLGSARYIPRWIGPLYVRDRHQAGESAMAGSQLDRADAAGHGGWSGAGRVHVAHRDLGRAEAGLESRPGLPPLAFLRVAAPSFRRVQLGGWAAVEGDAGAALAAEVRVPLPRGLFASGELSRHYSRTMAGSDAELSPLWVAALSVGATLGD